MFEVMNLFDGLISAQSYVVQNIDGGVRLLLSLPGVKKEDVNVRCTATDLKINVSAEVESPLLLKKKFAFSHKVYDPQPTAKISDGVLTVDLVSGKKDKGAVEVQVD